MSGKKFLAATGLALLSGACSGSVAGSGRVITETRAISEVNALTLGGVGELTIIQGEPESLVIEAEDNILPLIQTVTQGGTLEISEKGNTEPTRPIQFKLTVSELKKVVSTGAATVHADKFSSPGLLEIVLEGAGSLEMGNLECGSLKVVLSGAASAKVQGRTRDQNVEISGSADYVADDMRTQSTKIDISGAGSAKVWAIEGLDVQIGGSGNVDYFGEPTVKKEIGGSGSVHSLGKKARE